MPLVDIFPCDGVIAMLHETRSCGHKRLHQIDCAAFKKDVISSECLKEGHSLGNLH